MQLTLRILSVVECSNTITLENACHLRPCKKLLFKATYTYYRVTTFMLVVFAKWDNKLYVFGVKEKEGYNS